MIHGTMPRAAKGRVAPPPKLPAAAQRVADRVAAMPGVIAQAHWEIGSQTEVNGTDFYVDEHEVGHIHLDGEAHIALGAALGREVIAQGLARRFRWSDAFVVVDTAQAPDRAVQLFALRLEQLAGVDARTLRARVAALAAT